MNALPRPPRGKPPLPPTAPRPLAVLLGFVALTIASNWFA